MSGPHRIMIAEDHAIVREGLKSIFAFREEFEIVAEATDGLEAIRFAAEKKPDVLILDLTMPGMNGIDALREIKRASEATRVLVLTVHGTDEYVTTALQAGADGYVLKDSGTPEILLAVNSLVQGKRYLCAQIASTVISAYLGDKADSGSGPTIGELSERERQVLTLVAQGYRNRQIAEYLCISVKTVEKHRASLMQKLKLNTVPALTAYAIEKGLLSR